MNFPGQKDSRDKRWPSGDSQGWRSPAWPEQGHCARSSLHGRPHSIPSTTCDDFLISQMEKLRLAHRHTVGLKSKLFQLQRPGSQLGCY